MAERLSGDSQTRSAFIKARIAFGIGCARPSLMKATRTSALTRTSSPRRTSCPSMMDAPFTATGQVTISSMSSIRAGFRKSSVIERTTKAKPGVSVSASANSACCSATHQSQMIGAPTLHEAQIVGVIDDAGEIRVLVVDTNQHVMAAVTDLAVDKGIGHLPPSVAQSNRYAQIHLTRKRG